MRKIVMAAAAILAAAAAGIGSAATAASAVAAVPATFASSVTDSMNWGGYVARPAPGQHILGVRADLTVPRVSCSNHYGKAPYELGEWSGIDGFYSSSATVEQVGIGESCASAAARPQYFVWWEMYPEAASMQFNGGNGAAPAASGAGAVRPGDHVRLWVEDLGPGNGPGTAPEFGLYVYNLTTGRTYVETAMALRGHAPQDRTAEVITERPAGQNGRLYGQLLLGRGSIRYTQAEVITSNMAPGVPGNGRTYGRQPVAGGLGWRVLAPTIWPGKAGASDSFRTYTRP